MNLEKMDKAQRSWVERQLLKGYGELVKVEWKDIVAGAAVDKTHSYFVGRMSAGQTGQVVGILAKVFSAFQGESEQPEEEVQPVRKAGGGKVAAAKSAAQETKAESKPVAFNTQKLLEVLDGGTITHLIAVIIGESDDWTEENVPLLGVGFTLLNTFLKYNDFFGLIPQIMALVTNLTSQMESLDMEQLG